MGDKNRIPRCANKPYSDPEFERTLRDSDNGKLKHNLSPFFVRPLYQYTKAEVGRVPNLRRANHITDF